MTTKSDGIFSFLFSASLLNGKTIRFSPTGISMQPTLREGDVLTAKPIEYREAQIGDILVYQNLETRQIIVHRLIKKIKNSGMEMMLTMSEIGTQPCDLPLKPDNCIIAKVIAIERRGKIINLMTQKQVLKGRIISYLLARLPFIIAIRRKGYMAITRPDLILPNIRFLLKT